MTTPTQNDPTAHVTALLEAYVLGGLDDAERRAFEQHIAGCAACRGALDEVRNADGTLNAELAMAIPSPGFEDRVWKHVRSGMHKADRQQKTEQERWKIHRFVSPAVVRAATGVAAALLVTTVGYVVSSVAEGKRVYYDMAMVADVAPQRVDGAGRGVAAASQPTARDLYITGGVTLDKEIAAAPDESSVRAHGNWQERFGNEAKGKREDLSTERGRELGRWVDGVKSLEESRKEELREKGYVGVDNVRLSDLSEATRSESRTAPARPIIVPKEVGERQFSTLTDRSGGGVEHPGKYFDFENNERRGSSNQWFAQRARENTASPQNAQAGGQQGQQASAWDTDGNAVDKKSVASVPNFSDSPDFNLQGGRGGSGGGGGGFNGEGNGSFFANTAGSKPADVLGEKTNSLALAGSGALRFDGKEDYSGPRSGPADPAAPPMNGPASVSTLTGKRPAEPGVVALGVVTGPAPAGAPAPMVAARDAREGVELKNESDKMSKGVATIASPKLPALQGFRPTDHFYADADTKGGKKLDDLSSLKDTVAAPGKPVTAAPSTPTPKPAGSARNEAGDGPAQPGQTAPVETARPVENEPPKAIRRMIIRNGDVSFEVDSFDSAVMQISKIAAEEGGFVSTTSSDKLANGKVSGSVTVRCPPERLDTLVLKLRGIGDLKNQRIAATDVTKQYTDLESQLRAGKAMEERLLAIIKSGGAVKDLLEAEKQLGVWREKIERLQGEINYYANLVSLSTLNIQLMERDVRSPTAAAETETVNAGVVVDDVEKSRNEVLGEIQKAKGRIIESDLQKKTGEQYVAKIVADVPPDAAGPLSDRLRQLGKVSRMDANRRTETQGGAGPIIPGLKVDRRDTRFTISLYNLAGVEPRQVTNLKFAAPDVEATYRAILQQATNSGGRVVVSKLERPRPDQVTGVVRVHVPAERADAFLSAIRGGVDVLEMNIAVNPDAENSTDTKWGFEIGVTALADVPAREAITLQVYSPTVVAAFGKLADQAKSLGGKIYASQLNEQDLTNLTGTLEFDVPRDKWATIDALARESGLIISRANSRSADTANTVDSKVRLRLELYDEIRLISRESVGLRVATVGVPEAFGTLIDAAKAAGARAIVSNLNVANRNDPEATLSFSVTKEQAAKFETAAKAAGLLVSRTIARQPDSPTVADHRVSFDVRLISENRLIARETVASRVASRTVQETHRTLVAAAQKAGAKVVNSNLQENDPQNPTGRLSFAIDREKAADFESAMAKAGLVVIRNSTRQAEREDVVDSKVGYVVEVVAERSLTPRESISLDVIATTSRDRYTKALEAATASEAYVLRSDFSAHPKVQIQGTLVVLIERKRLAEFERALTEGADVFNRNVVRSNDTTAVEHLVLVSAQLGDAERYPPRYVYELEIATSNVDAAVGDLEAQVVAMGGRKQDGSRTTDVNGSDRADLELNVPAARAAELVTSARGKGRVMSAKSNRDDRVMEGTLSRARVKLVLSTAQTVGADRSLGDTIREGVNSGLTGLVVALKFVIMGLLVVAPALLVVWVVMRILRGSKKAKTSEQDATPPSTPSSGGPTPTPA